METQENIQSNISERETHQDVYLGDPKNCACCFNLKGVAISLIVSLVALSILVFALDFTILEVQRLERDGQDKLQLVQEGGVLEDDYYFSYYWRLQVVDLRDVEVNVSLLAEYITGYRLKVIRLRDLKLSGKLHRREYFDIPNLEEFTFELNQPIGPLEAFQIDPCEDCVMENVSSSLESIRQRHCLEPLFFYTNTGNLPKLFNSKANITLTVFGRTLLRIIHNYEDKIQVTMMFSDCEGILEMLSEVKHNVNKLSISGCTNLKAKSLLLFLTSSKLTHLLLDNVTFVGLHEHLRIAEMFKNSNSLTELIIKNGAFKEQRLPTTTSTIQQLSIDLHRDLPISLKSLVLSGVTILQSTGAATNVKLDSIKLNNVSFENLVALLKFPNELDAQKFVFRQLKLNGKYVQQDSSLWLPVLDRAMEMSKMIWFENVFHFSITFADVMSNDTSRHMDSILGKTRSVFAFRAWLHQKGIDSTVMTVRGITAEDTSFALIKSGGEEGQGSWELEANSDGSSGPNLNENAWFHSLRLGTFIRENIHKVVDW